jgi:hypothetical protein
MVSGNLMAKEAPDEIPNMYLGFWVKPNLAVHALTTTAADF